MSLFKFFSLGFILAGAGYAHAGWTSTGLIGQTVAFTSTTSSIEGWALDSSSYPLPKGGLFLSRFTGGATITVPGGLVDLDIVNGNEIWGVSNNGGVFRNVTANQTGGGTWIQISTPASARRVATGSNGDAYILTTEPLPGGYRIYKYDGSGTDWTDWQLISGGLIELDVDNNGDLWGVSNEYRVFLRPSGGSWQVKTATNVATNVAAGGGNVYMTTKIFASTGFLVTKWNGSFFITTNGYLVDIQADAGGRLWGATAKRSILNYTP